MGNSVNSYGRAHSDNIVPRSLDQAGREGDKGQLYKFLFDNARDIILLVDLAGRIVEANRAAVTTYGYSPEELLSLSIHDLRAMSAAPSVAAQMAQADTRGILFEAVHRRKDGTTFPVEVNSQGVCLNGERVLLSIIRDIGERKRAEDDQERLRSAVETELVELDRLKDQFITVAAHELKTPVAVMKGYAQLLLRSAAGLTAAQRSHLEAINRGSDRMNRIINELLEVSQFQLGHIELRPETVQISQLVSKAVGRFAAAVPSHHLGVKCPGQAAVRADADRLERVLSSLLDNAVRYSSPGSNVEVHVAVQGGEAVVTVTDHGIGIPLDRQARIFELFYRAHSGTPWDYGGMGVGLHISREIVAMHHGRIWFESEEGHGSSFHFSLPLGDRDD